MVAVFMYKVKTLVGGGEQHVGIVLLDEVAALLGGFAHDYALGLFEHCAD